MDQTKDFQLINVFFNTSLNIMHNNITYTNYISIKARNKKKTKTKTNKQKKTKTKTKTNQTLPRISCVKLNKSQFRVLQLYANVYQKLPYCESTCIRGYQFPWFDIKLVSDINVVIIPSPTKLGRHIVTLQSVLPSFR